MRAMQQVLFYPSPFDEALVLTSMVSGNGQRVLLVSGKRINSTSLPSLNSLIALVCFIRLSPITRDSKLTPVNIKSWGSLRTESRFIKTDFGKRSGFTGRRFV